MRYKQYKIMQDIREIKFRYNESNVNTKICFEIRATALRLHLLIEGFSLYRPHRTPTQGTSTEDLGNTNREYTTPLSNKYNLYTRGKAQHKSPLHLEGWALSQTTINLTLEG